MLTKNQNSGIIESMEKNARNILRLIQAEKTNMAYVKYESIYFMLKNLGLDKDFDKIVKNQLLEGGYNESQIESFTLSYINYRTGETTVERFN